MLTHDESMEKVWKRFGQDRRDQKGLIGKRGEEQRKKSSFKNSPRLIIGLDPMSA